MANIFEIVNHNLNAQDYLNTVINPNWRQDRSLFDFYIASKQEISEMIDSLPWKWWKKMDEDIDNIKIELVDIWHFYLSSLLLVNNKNIAPNITNIIMDVWVNESELDNKHTLILAAELDFMLYESTYQAEMLYNGKLPKLFFTLVKRYFETFEDFFKLYYLKWALNISRQIQGYKTGQYRKVINGIEDNELLHNYMPTIKLDEILDKHEDELAYYLLGVIENG
jgi:hypothetical protein